MKQRGRFELDIWPSTDEIDVEFNSTLDQQYLIFSLKNIQKFIIYVQDIQDIQNIQDIPISCVKFL
jgi:hypothetical protein